MAAPIIWALEKLRSFCKRKPPCPQNSSFEGGGIWGFSGEGSADFVFMGAGIFLILQKSYLNFRSGDYGPKKRPQNKHIRRIPGWSLWALHSSTPPSLDHMHKMTILQTLSDLQGRGPIPAHTRTHKAIKHGTLLYDFNRPTVGGPTPKPRHASVLRTHSRERKQGSFTKGDFSLEESLESLQSLDSLDSLETRSDSPLFSTLWGICWISGISQLTESLENGHFWRDPFSKDPFFPSPHSGKPFPRFTACECLSASQHACC